MHDNKVRLSADVLEKAEQIASEWGLKNVRAAVEAVFRRYADDYLYGRGGLEGGSASLQAVLSHQRGLAFPQVSAGQPHDTPSDCEALDALNDLLGA
jgi:hypothetical protein